MKAFLSQFFSVDERRTSTLVIAFLVTLGTALFFYSQRGDITANLTNIILVFIGAIAGINLPSGIAGLITSTETYQIGKNANTQSTTKETK